jgi:hypothetical protein
MGTKGTAPKATIKKQWDDGDDGQQRLTTTRDDQRQPGQRSSLCPF